MKYCGQYPLLSIEDERGVHQYFVQLERVILSNQDYLILAMLLEDGTINDESILMHATYIDDELELEPVEDESIYDQVEQYLNSK